MDDQQPAKGRGHIVIPLVIGAGFALVFGLYMLRAVDIPTPIKLLADVDAGPRFSDQLAVGEKVAVAFVDHLSAARFADAYLLMTGSYRARASVEDFRKAWAAPLLAGPRRFRRTTSRAVLAPSPGGGLVAPALFTTRGVLVASAGSLDVSFTFQVKDNEADNPRILAVLVGGVPIVQGLAP